MTIARDPRTGAVLGQVAGVPCPRCGKPTQPPLHACAASRSNVDVDTLRLLTAGGRYVTVPAHSVRLEELR